MTSRMCMYIVMNVMRSRGYHRLVYTIRHTHLNTLVRTFMYACICTYTFKTK